jgi:hypothetical protein
MGTQQEAVDEKHWAGELALRGTSSQPSTRHPPGAAGQVLGVRALMEQGLWC